MSATESLQSLGFAEPRLSDWNPEDHGLPTLSPDLRFVKVFFPATEPEMVVRCQGGTGVVGIVPLTRDMEMGETEIVDVAAQACLQQLDA